jgi:hypothetical protein
MGAVVIATILDLAARYVEKSRRRQRARHAIRTRIYQNPAADGWGHIRVKNAPMGDRGALDAPVGPISPDGGVTGDNSRPHPSERTSSASTTVTRPSQGGTCPEHQTDNPARPAGRAGRRRPSH